jgi:Zn-dependent membrane protease YugP
MGGYMVYMIIAGVLSMIGMFVSNRLKSKFQHYSQIPLQSGLSGKEVAEKMLQHYGIHDVKVVPAQGVLTDHYNPSTKTIALSEPVFNARSIAAAAVAAHECGHAVQHDTSYAWLKMRSAIVPVVNIASKAQQFLLMAALGMFGMGGNPVLLFITVIAFGVTALFSFITLPVEFDASNRAMAWLDETGIARGTDYDGAKDALWWAAMTYVSAALGALVYFLFFVLKFASSR